MDPAHAYSADPDLVEVAAQQTMARMAEEHEEWIMIQRARDIEEEEHATLQKIGKKRHMKTNNLRIELPALNMALVEVYQELAKTTSGQRYVL